MGSLATSGAIPKDADVLVTTNGTMDLGELARAGRRLKGSAQAINLGADNFLADVTGRYLGRMRPLNGWLRRSALLWWLARGSFPVANSKARGNRARPPQGRPETIAPIRRRFAVTSRDCEEVATGPWHRTLQLPC